MPQNAINKTEQLPYIVGTNNASGALPSVGATDSSGAPILFNVPPAVAPGRIIPAKEITAQIVADWLVGFCQEHGDVITNMRLQRLLYFAQAWHLALEGSTLFPELMQAWPSGPVQPDVFARFSYNEHRPIESHRSAPRLPKAIVQHLNDVMRAYGTLNAFELELQAQRDLPWNEARIGLSDENPARPAISNQSMRKFYRKRLDGEKGKAQNR